MDEQDTCHLGIVEDLHTAGAKDDGEKPNVYSFFIQYFPRAIEAVTRVSEYGATKYTPFGWMHVPDGTRRYSDALMRHVMAEARGRVYNDADGGVMHAAQVAWGAMARLELMLREEERRTTAAILSPYSPDLPID